MSPREKALSVLRANGAEDLIPILGLDQPEVLYSVPINTRPGRTARPKGYRTSPNYRGGA